MGADEQRLVQIPPHHLEALLGMPAQMQGLVVFGHGSGSGRLSPRNQHVAASLRAAGFATLLLDLLMPHEESERAKVFDIDLLASRLREAHEWTDSQADLAQSPFGYFGASTGGAAALVAASHPGARVDAVVSRGGRPDLAGSALPLVRAPTLLIVGALDTQVMDLNRLAMERLGGERVLSIVPGASHLFEEPGTLDQVVRLAASWFRRHLAGEADPSRQ